MNYSIDTSSWDWNPGKKFIVDIDKIKTEYAEIQEIVVSNNGEKLALPVKNEDGTFTACVNGEPWSNSFEKLWYLRFSPDDRLTGLVMSNDEWTVAIDGESWAEKFEYVWNPQFNRDGKHIAIQVK